MTTPLPDEPSEPHGILVPFEPARSPLVPEPYGTSTQRRKPDTSAAGKRGQCTAHRRDGQRCTRWAIAGGTVCPTHGGSSPVVKDKARLRIQSLIEPAIATLAREMTTATASADRQRAANSILDRGGYGRTMNVEGDGARDLLVDLLLGQINPDGK
jgi:hypothetical protein